MPAGMNIPTNFTAVDKFTSVVAKMTSGVTNFSKQTGAAVSRFDKKITAQFKKLSNLSQLAIGLSIGAVFTTAARDITTYETGLIGVSKTTNIVDKDLEKFSSAIINTSKKLRTVSPHQLLEVAQSAGQLGVTGNKNILKFAETMVKLQDATGGLVGGEQGAAAIARILNVTGEGAAVVDRFSSALVNLGNNAAANEQEILNVSNEVARSTAAYGLAAKEVLGLSTAFVAMGVQPEAAGSAIGKTIRQIELATISGGEKLDKFAKISGVSSKQFVTAFKDNPVKAFDLFVKGLNKVDASGGSMTKSLIDVGLKGETVSKGIIPLAANVEELDRVMKIASNGFQDNIAVNQEFEAANKTIQKSLDAIRISFSNVILESTTTSGTLTIVSDAFFWISENMDTVVSAAVLLVGAFVAMKGIVWAYNTAAFINAAVIGLQAAAAGTLNATVKKNTVSMIAYRAAMIIGTIATKVATLATTAFAFAMNAGIWPITLIILAIIAVIAIIMNWSKITDWFGKIWQKFTTWIGGLWDDLVSWFQNFDFKQFFKDIGQGILKFLLMPVKTLLILVSKLPGKVGEMAKMGLEKIGELTGEIDVNNQPLTSPEQQQAETIVKTQQQGQLNVQIKDRGGNVESTEGTGNIPIIITETQGAF